MPSKSRGKRRSKKRKLRQGFSVSTAQQSATVQGYEPASPMPDPSAEVPTPKSAQTTIRYPYITGELRRIAIVAGIMLAALVVVYLVIS